MTSSLRNSIHRRNHKERSQLARRSRLGILEKHADYVLRARDYHSKQDRITRLRQKAAERNKDEFYFSMTKERTQEGVHIKDRGNLALPTDIVKVLKTQDENYVRTMRAAGLKKIDQIKKQLTALADLVRPTSLDRGKDDDGQLDDEELEVLRQAGVIARPSGRGKAQASPRHIIFVENQDEARQYVIKKTRVDADADTSVPKEEAVDLGWKLSAGKKKKRKVRETNDESEQEMAAEEGRDGAARRRKHLLQELAARLERDTQLRYAQREFEMQRLLMGKGGRTRLSGVEKVEEDADDADDGKGKSKSKNEKLYKPRVYKWRQERKR